jgi:hypothetical protein
MISHSATFQMGRADLEGQLESDIRIDLIMMKVIMIYKISGTVLDTIINYDIGCCLQIPITFKCCCGAETLFPQASICMR